MNLKVLFFKNVDVVCGLIRHVRSYFIKGFGFLCYLLLLWGVFAVTFDETFSRDELLVIYVIFIGTQLISVHTLPHYLKSAILLNFFDVTIFLILVLPIILIMSHQNKLNMYIILSIGQYLCFFLLPCIAKLVSSKNNYIEKKYAYCGIIVVFEKNYTDTLSNIIDNLKTKYDIRLIVNLTNVKLNIGIKEIKTLKKLNLWFLSLSNIFGFNKVKKIVYVSAELDVSTIRGLIAISSRYNLMLFRTHYLSDIAKDSGSECNLVPVTINDVVNYCNVAPDQKSFLLHYFRNKNVFVDYDGEPLILSLITEIVQARVAFITVFVASESKCADIKLIFEDFSNLPYAIKIGNVAKDLNSKMITAETVVISVQVYKEPFVGVENIIKTLQNNTVNAMKLIDMCVKQKVAMLLMLSDTETVYGKSWVGLTQRIAEFYAKAQENCDICQIVRIPFSATGSFSLVNRIDDDIRKNGACKMVHGCADVFVNQGIVVSTVLQAMSNMEKFKLEILTVMQYELCKIIEIYNLSLNIYGLKFEPIEEKKVSKKRARNDEFKPLPVNVKETEFCNIGSEKITNYTKVEIANLMAQFTPFIKRESLSEIVDLGINILNTLYFGKKEEENK